MRIQKAPSFNLPSRSSWLAIAAMVLLLGGTAAEAQRRAVPRSGGGGGGGGGSHVSGGGGSSSRGGSRVSGGSHRPSGRGRAAVPRAGSGGRSGPHRPTGVDRRFSRGGRHGRGGYFYSPRHYNYGHYGHYDYYNSFYFGLGYGYPYYYGYRPFPAYYSSYGYYPYPAVADTGPEYDREAMGALSLKVKPRNAEVYVDGSYVGAAKSFDGTPRYLWLPPGRYDLTLYYPGYDNLETSIQVTPGEVLGYALELERGGESRRPGPPSDRSQGRDWEEADEPRAWESSPGRDPVSRTPIDDDLRREPGGVVLDVHPADASVYLDGRFIGTGREVSTLRSPLLVDPGVHSLQVVHPDYRSQDLEFEIGSGDERELDVALDEKGR